MSDTQPPLTEPATPPPAAPPDTQPPPAAAPNEPLGDGGIRALEAERARRKALEAEVAALQPLAQQAREQADAKKSEVERLTEQAAAAAAERDQARSEALRVQAALAAAPVGMDPTQIAGLAARLRGDDLDALTADAQALFGQMNLAPVQPQSPTTGPPVESLRPGALPKQPEKTLAEQIADAEAAGDKEKARRLKVMMAYDAKPAAG